MPRRGAGVETPRNSKPQSPLRITHDSEFYARLLTKESSQGNSSFRYYGAGPGTVPFVWESQPGTPKDDAYSSVAAAVVRAITPPPSYHLRAASGGPHGHGGSRHRNSKAADGRASKYCGYKLNKWIKIGFIATVFRRAFGKPTRPSSSSSPAASSVKSSSTRWLFSGSGAAEARDLQQYCCYEPPQMTTRGCTASVGSDRTHRGWCSSGAAAGGSLPAGCTAGARSRRPVAIKAKHIYVCCAPSVPSASVAPCTQCRGRPN